MTSIELAIDLSKLTISMSSQDVSSLSSTHKSLIETLVDHQIPEVSVSSKIKFDIRLNLISDYENFWGSVDELSKAFNSSGKSISKLSNKFFKTILLFIWFLPDLKLKNK